jgi:hypothetical protein
MRVFVSGSSISCDRAVLAHEQRQPLAVHLGIPPPTPNPELHPDWVHLSETA